MDNRFKDRGGRGLRVKLITFATAVTLSGVTAIVPFAAVADHTTAHTIEQLTKQIEDLKVQLTTLSGAPAVSAGAGAKCSFIKSLTVGSRGDDVMCLQKYLNGAGYQIAASGAGSPGSETTYFGGLTKKAVAKWQAAMGVSPAVGYFGSISRAKYDSTVAAAPAVPVPTPATPGTPAAPTPAGSGLTVTAAVDQPAAALAPADAARVPFTKIIFTASPDGDVKVNSLTVERQGPGQNSRLSGVILLDEDNFQVGVEKTLNSDNRTNLTEPFTVKAGTSRTMTLAGNRAATGEGGAGEVIRLALVAVDAGSTKVNGTFPMSGNGMTINTTLTIGTVTNRTGAYKSVATTTETIGNKAFTFASIRVSAGSQEKIRVLGIRWNQVGSAGVNDTANVKTYIEDKAYDVVIEGDGKYYVSKFGEGLVLDKGAGAEIYLKGDIVGGSNRTIKFDIYRTTDLTLKGETYGFGITPPTSGTGFTSTNPWYFASQVTVGKGTINIENAASEAPAANIAVNVSGQVLGAFRADTRGEDISVGSMVFGISVDDNGTASLNTVDVTSIGLYDDTGKLIAGPADGVAAGTVTFSDSVVFPVAKKVYTIKGKLGIDFVSDTTVIASTTPSTGWTTVRGLGTTETIVPTPSTAVSGSTMTVKAAALAISVLREPVAQNVVAGSQSFVFAKYTLDATKSGEDVRLPSLPIEYNAASGATNLTSCQLFDGATTLNTGSNLLNPTAAGSSTVITFDGSGFIVPKSTAKTLELKCHIAPGTTANTGYSWGYDSSASPSITGLTSGQSVTPTENDYQGQQMIVVASGSFTVALDSSSPSYRVGIAGTTNNTVSTFRLTSTNEALTLTDFALVLDAVDTSNASSSPQDVIKVTLWDDATKIGEAFFIGRNYQASSTITGVFTVPKDGSKILTAKADFAAQGTSLAGTPGVFILIDWDNASADATKARGIASSQTILRTNGTTTASAGVRVVKSVPTLELVALPSAKLIASRVDLFRFKITASSAGDVGIAKLTFRVATSSATQQKDMVDNLNVYVYTDSGFSTTASGIQADGAFLATSVDLTGVADNAGSGTSWASGSTDIEFWPATTGAASTTVSIPAGQTRYFALKADALTAGTQFNVSTQLQGDSKFASDLATGACCTSAGWPHAVASSTYLATTTYLKVQADNDFIWTPYSTTTVQGTASNHLTNNDFMNGLGVPGVPNVNTNSQVMTQ